VIRFRSPALVAFLIDGGGARRENPAMTARSWLLLALVLPILASGAACSRRARATEPCETPGPRGWGPPDLRPKVTGPSAGCARPRAADGVFRRTLTVEGKVRRYLMVTASAVPAGVKAPLIFVFHGRGGSPDRVRRNGFESTVKGRAIIVYPQGLSIPDPDAPSGWDLRTKGDDFAFFDRLLETVGDAYCVDFGRVFATGHSFGGWMTNRLGYARGSRLRGIAPSAGGLSPGDCGGRPLAAMILHARNDGTVNFVEGEAAHAMWSKAAGCRADTKPADAAGPCVAHEGCVPEAPVWLCAHGQYHSWPTFGASAIWAFFERLR